MPKPLVLTGPRDVLLQTVFGALAGVALAGVRDAQIMMGDDVAICGLGTIGLLVAQLARLSGALRVDGLITQRYPYHKAPATYRLIDEHAADTIKVVLAYESGQ